MPPTVPDEAGVAFVKDWQDVVDQHNAANPVELVLLCPIHGLVLVEAEMRPLDTRVLLPPEARKMECPNAESLTCGFHVYLAIRPKETR
jgi:hypothetical protein